MVDITKSAKTISLDSIRCVNDTQFHVASQSNLGKCYLVDIQRLICDCLDYPRIQICKHLCAVKIWYPFIPSVNDQDQDLERLLPISSQVAATPTFLSGEVPHHMPNSKSGMSSNALPDWECLSPNQNLWAATVKWMGIRTPPKRCQNTCTACYVQASHDLVNSVPT